MANKSMSSKYPFGLQVVKKTYAGVTVGYVVGWWRFCGLAHRRGPKDRSGFQSVREGLLFPTQMAAESFRDDIEKARGLSCAYVNFHAVN